MRELWDIAALSGRLMCIFNLKKALSIYEIPAAETLRFLTLTIEFWAWVLQKESWLCWQLQGKHLVTQDYLFTTHFSQVTKILTLEKKRSWLVCFFADVNLQRGSASVGHVVLLKISFQNKYGYIYFFTGSRPDYSCRLCIPRTSEKVKPRNIFRRNPKKKTGKFGPCDTTGWLRLRQDFSSSNQYEKGKTL